MDTFLDLNTINTVTDEALDIYHEHAFNYLHAILDEMSKRSKLKREQVAQEMNNLRRENQRLRSLLNEP